MRAGDLVGLEALAARVPFVFPVDGGFLIVCRRPGDPPHPLFLKGVGVHMRWGQHQRQRRELQPGSTAATAVAIPCHDANILLRRRLVPAGGSRCKFRFDLGGDVAEVRRHCAKFALASPATVSPGSAAQMLEQRLNVVARLGNRQQEVRSDLQNALRLAPSQSITGCERKIWMQIPSWLYYLKRPTVWNFTI